MSTFKVTYPSGVVEVEVVDECETVEQYVNRKFGSADHEAYGTKVEIDGADESEPQEVTLQTAEKPKETVMKVETGAVGSKLS